VLGIGVGVRVALSVGVRVWLGLGGLLMLAWGCDEAAPSREVEPVGVDARDIGPPAGWVVGKSAWCTRCPHTGGPACVDTRGEGLVDNKTTSLIQRPARRDGLSAQGAPCGIVPLLFRKARAGTQNETPRQEKAAPLSGGKPAQD